MYICKQKLVFIRCLIVIRLYHIYVVCFSLDVDLDQFTYVCCILDTYSTYSTCLQKRVMLSAYPVSNYIALKRISTAKPKKNPMHVGNGGGAIS